MMFTDPGPLVRFARLRAARRTYDGCVNAANQMLIRQCTHALQLDPERAAILIYTRDTGHHSSGWWKNPDYERCLHLSLSYCALPSRAALAHDRPRSAELAALFFGEDRRLAWIEGPYTPEGKARAVWHYRVFCNAAWQPTLPRGEVYSRDWTPPDWRSFSEVHGLALTDVDAPFLTAASE